LQASEKLSKKYKKLAPNKLKSEPGFPIRDLILDTPARPFTIDEYLCMIMDKYASTEKAAYAMVRREERRTLQRV
jgi:hypothetical protein